MLNIRLIFNWVIKPLVIIGIMTMALSKMCDTLSVFGIQVNKLSTSLEMMKKSSEEISNISVIVNTHEKISTIVSNQVYSTSNIFNTSKSSKQGEWVFNK